MEYVVFCALLLTAGAAPSRKLELRDYWNNIGEDELKRHISLTPNSNPARNVVLFLGDGMGVSAVTGARIYKGQLAGKTGEETRLCFETFPYVGLAKPYNTDRQISDSSGAATAIFSGVKTRSGVVGVDDRVTKGECDTYTPETDLQSIFVKAKAAGKSVGLVTNGPLTGATSATAYAHSPERWWQLDHNIPRKCRNKVKDIARQFVQNSKYFNVVFAGGRQNFLPNTTRDPEYPERHGERRDGRNLIKEWEQDKERGNVTYKYMWRQKEFDQLNPGQYEHVLGLFQTGGMHYEAYRMTEDGAGEPSLSEMTAKAIQLLQGNPKGFFLFVEGDRVDNAQHSKRAKLAFTEILELEKAVEKSLNLTDSRETLTIVTADHSHGMVIAGDPIRGNPILGLASPDKAKDGKQYTTIFYANGQSPPGPRVDPATEDTQSLEYTFQSGIPLGAGTHSGEDVPVYATGPRSYLLAGVYEQHYIGHAMTHAMELRSETSGTKSFKTALSILNIMCVISIFVIMN